MLLASGMIQCPPPKALLFRTAGLMVPYAGVVCLSDARPTFFGAAP